MSIASKLTKLETDITSAYSSVGNKGGTIPADKNTNNLPTAIDSIPSGSAPQEVDEGVNFIDYDGSLLYSYSKNEAAELTSLPDLPSQKDGLTSVSWNWTLENIKDYLQNVGDLLYVGCSRITSDNKTKIFINLAKGENIVNLTFNQSISNGVLVDWGDGTTSETFSGTSVATTHTYHVNDEYKDFTITFTIQNGTLTFAATNKACLYMNAYNNAYESGFVVKVQIGTNTVVSNYAFYRCVSLKTINLPNASSLDTTTSTMYVFKECYSLECIVMPKNFGLLYYHQHDSNYSLKIASIPYEINTIYGNALSNCYNLKTINLGDTLQIRENILVNDYSLDNIAIPNTITTLSNNMLQYCHSLKKIKIYSTIFLSKNGIFNSCKSLTYIKIPQGTTAIGSNVFFGCISLRLIDCTACTSVPTLSNVNAFNNTPTDKKIVVPDSLYTTWIGSTNWSSFSSNIVKESDFNA